MIRDEREIAKLYIYFDKIIRQEKVDRFTPDLLCVKG